MQLSLKKGDNDAICEMDNLDRALCNAKTVEEIDDLLESAAPDLRGKYLQNTIDKLCSVYNDTQALKDNNQVSLYCFAHKDIDNISIAVIYYVVSTYLLIKILNSINHN